MWRESVTDYPLLLVNWGKPHGCEWRGDNEYIILWSPNDELHVDLKAPSTPETRRIACQQIKSARIYKAGGGKIHAA